MTADSLRPVAAGVAVIFACLVPVHLFVLRGDKGVIMAIIAGSISLMLFVLWHALNTDLAPLLERHAQAVGAAVGIVCAVETLAHMATVGEPWVTTAVLLVVMAVGACLSSRGWGALVIVATDLGWLGVVLVLGPNSVWWQAGAQLASASVLAAVFNVIRYRTVERLEVAKAALASMAVTDELTGLANRRGLLLTGQPRLEAARRDGRQVTILYLDVDGLKLVNDEQGHAAGDRLIVDTGDILRDVFHSADVVARLGGDEFAVLLSGAGEPETTSLRERLRDRLAIAGISASVGVHHDVATQTLEQLIDIADLGMYAAKRERRTTGPRDLRLA
ncbi:MAG TPA: GGDEF domain-containing protein [Mycobacteriales bacterium]|jgi:diguanylate cyclase (GGDEF)-like protein